MSKKWPHEEEPVNSMILRLEALERTVETLKRDLEEI